MSTCTNKVGITFANTVRISNTLKVGSIVPVKTGDTIELDGFRKTGEKDLIQINFPFNANSFPSAVEFIYTADRPCTVISVKEAHAVPSANLGAVNITKRSGVIETILVATFTVDGPANTTQTLPVIVPQSSLIANDSLKVVLVDNIGNLAGAVISIVIELN